MFDPSRLLAWTSDYLWPIFHPLTRYLAAWALTLGLACAITINSWDRRQDLERASGTDGHTTIDFGGQWAMGRMLVTGRGWNLFERHHLRVMLEYNYPLDDQTPKQLSGEEMTDAESLMWCFMGKDDKKAAETYGYCLAPLMAAHALDGAVLVAGGAQEVWTPAKLAHAAERRPGGPLYPPINAFVFAPLGVLPPLYAFRCHQIQSAVLALLAGLGVSVITRARIWWPVAAAVILIFPGFPSAQAIGQNSVLTLAIVVWGWALLSRGEACWGGGVFGLLAFKPVWALSFLLALLITRRWRASLAMMATGAAQIVLTLPFVGLHTWFDWLEIGKEAAALYNVDQNWIELSRDLLSLPRHFLIDFEKPSRERDHFLATLASWTLLIGVLEVWVRMCIVRRGTAQMVTGAPAAFVLLGASLCCYHYMYYDYLLIVFPALLLFVRPRFADGSPTPEAPPHHAADYLERAEWTDETEEHVQAGPRTPFEDSGRATDNSVSHEDEQIVAGLPLAPAPQRIDRDSPWSFWSVLETCEMMLPFLAILAWEHVWPHLVGYNRRTPWHTAMAVGLWLLCGLYWWTKLEWRLRRPELRAATGRERSEEIAPYLQPRL